MASLPVIAQQISGKQYRVEPNPLGWRAVTFRFAGRDVATAHVEFVDGRVEKRAVGLDGVPRVSPNGRFGLPVALQGTWTDASTFVFDYDEVGNINSFVCRFTFEDKTAVVDVKERSGELELRMRATAVD